MLLKKETYSVELPDAFWIAIEQLQRTGLHGQTRDDVIATLLRPSIIEAVTAGFVKRT